ncbi:hypothetical protein cyc_07947 [Cyclospora cayetanensis]|uniref:Uncharacterized protein n=1 Tax=Cyclospora cayetanensis TaxID=88456 RepID=A0A1D3CVI1_9EIME|nr:hypothetical protein cyc_07947 [Cyclospora cayetanensis]
MLGVLRGDTSVHLCFSASPHVENSARRAQGNALLQQLQRKYALLQQQQELDASAAAEKQRLQQELLDMREQLLQQKESVAAAQQMVIEELQQQKQKLVEEILTQNRISDVLRERDAQHVEARTAAAAAKEELQQIKPTIGQLQQEALELRVRLEEKEKIVAFLQHRSALAAAQPDGSTGNVGADDIKRLEEKKEEMEALMNDKVRVPLVAAADGVSVLRQQLQHLEEELERKKKESVAADARGAAEEEKVSLVRNNASLLREVERLRAEAKTLNSQMKDLIAGSLPSSGGNQKAASQQQLLLARLEEAALLRTSAEEEIRCLRLERAQGEAQLKELRRQIEDLKAAAQREESQTEELQRQLQLTTMKDHLLSRMPALELSVNQLRAKLWSADSACAGERD